MSIINLPQTVFYDRVGEREKEKQVANVVS